MRTYMRVHRQDYLKYGAWRFLFRCSSSTFFSLVTSWSDAEIMKHNRGKYLEERAYSGAVCGCFNSSRPRFHKRCKCTNATLRRKYDFPFTRMLLNTLTVFHGNGSCHHPPPPFFFVLVATLR